MEVSIKAPVVQAAAVMAGFMAFLAEVGAERDNEQQTKTRWALEFYVGKLARKPARQAVGQAGAKAGKQGVGRAGKQGAACAGPKQARKRARKPARGSPRGASSVKRAARKAP